MTHAGELWIRVDDGGAIVGVGEGAAEIDPSAEALRLLARTAPDGQYRPLSGARGLRKNWFVRCDSEFPVDAAIEAVYPLATVHRRQWKDGSLRVVPLGQVLERQTGRYEVAAQLPQEGRERARRVLCESVCVRVPVWAGTDCGEEDIPCPEACSVLVALAREAALWEAERPEPAATNGDVAFAAFDEPGNAIREAYLRLMQQEGPTV